MLCAFVPLVIAKLVAVQLLCPSHRLGPLTYQLVEVARGDTGWCGPGGHASRKSRRRGGKDVLVVSKKGVALGDVRIGLNLGKCQYQCDTSIAVGEDGRPVIALS